MYATLTSRRTPLALQAPASIYLRYPVTWPPIQNGVANHMRAVSMIARYVVKSTKSLFPKAK
jgi:hypothetical protein